MSQSSFLSGSLPAGGADKGITDKVEIKDFMNIDAVKEFVPDKVTYSEK